MTNCHATVVEQLVLQTSFGGRWCFFQIHIKLVFKVVFIFFLVDSADDSANNEFKIYVPSVT